LLSVLAACSSWLENPPPPPPPPGTPMLEPVGTFESPVYLTSPRLDATRLFIVEQAGRIRVVRNDTILPRAFLDIRGKISSGDERGLLSLAFHPQYAVNGQFYVYFTDPLGDLRIVRYNVSATDADSADEATADTVLKVAHPGEANHNGGQLQFGPDGMLYVGTGDGGGAGDPDTNSQNKHRLLGKLLRLDVSGASGYTIPTGNPGLTDTNFAPEVWSYGLRNPWRFSFDKSNGDLYIADVGQSSWEEVNVSPTTAQAGRGVNFGWNVMEGQHCYPFDPCTTTGLTQPVHEYAHAFGTCSITGGYVYRGTAIPDLPGHYFYADFCTGTVASFRYNGSATSHLDWSQLISPGDNISSFGQDAVGELYILQLTGPVFRIAPSP
jgi:hypothetical protein